MRTKYAFVNQALENGAHHPVASARSRRHYPGVGVV